MLMQKIRRIWLMFWHKFHAKFQHKKVLFKFFLIQNILQKNLKINIKKSDLPQLLLLIFLFCVDVYKAITT